MQLLGGARRPDWGVRLHGLPSLYNQNTFDLCFDVLSRFVFSVLWLACTLGSRAVHYTPGTSSKSRITQVQL